MQKPQGGAGLYLVALPSNLAGSSIMVSNTVYLSVVLCLVKCVRTTRICVKLTCVGHVDAV
jgi:hypothetical protein